MNTIRIMTYHIRRCRGGDGQLDVQRVCNVVGEAAPDVVALQDIGFGPGASQVQELADRLGMQGYGGERPGGNGFISYYPLRAVREHALGGAGVCLCADLDYRGRRVHLFNVRFDPSPARQRWQLAKLMGPELLGSSQLACPVVLLGDFANTLWGMSWMGLAANMRLARRPLWSATYPARFPLIARDRVYLRGQIRTVDTRILRCQKARMASTHLPHLLTLQIGDPASYLHLEKMNRTPMEPAAGC